MPGDEQSDEPRAVLFDVSGGPPANEGVAGGGGTLVDTPYLHAVCWAEALRQGGHPVPMATVHRAIGMGSAELLDRLLGVDRDHGDDEVLDTAHLTLYKQFWGRLRLLPGAVELLRACTARGLRTVLASSASDEELDALRSALDADDAITAATGSDDAKAGKPAPDILLAALDRVGAVAQNAVFVGDAVWDGQAAKAAQLPFVGLTCGGSSEAELRENGAVEVWRDPADLFDHIEHSRLGQLR